MRVVEQVAFQRLDLRLACLLGQLFERNKSAAISMTHEDLARELGTTRVVVSRLLKEFERMGCIRLQRGQIELLSSEALERLSRD
jgi:CRP/FNR family transcriptional regulator